MKLISLEISGFKHYSASSKINFEDEHKNPIVEIQDKNKFYLFEIILAIIFGLNDEEKQKFRGDVNESKTHTGLLTFNFDHQTMIIERDFSTNFVACLLSDAHTAKPIFQGKDYVGSDYSRPYLQMLQTVFPLIDKTIYQEIIHALYHDKQATLSDILNTFSLILSPRFKINRYYNLLKDTYDFMQSDRDHLDEIKRNGKAESLYLNTKKELLERALKIKGGIDDIQQLKEQFSVFVDKIRRKKQLANSALTILNERFAPIKSHNALQVRADVLLWKSLKDLKNQSEQKLQSLKSREQEIQSILADNFKEYESLPNLFLMNIDHMLELRRTLEQSEKEFKHIQNQIVEEERRLVQKSRFKWILLLATPPLVFLAAFLLFGNNWLLTIPESILTIIIILFFYSHKLDKIRDKIHNLTEESHILQKRMFDLKNEMERLQAKYPLLKDEDELPKHIERFKKYRSFQIELKQLRKEINYTQSSLESDSYIRQLPELEEKYQDLIDLERPDLEDYLNDFVSIKRQMLEMHAQNIDFPETEFLNEVNFKYDQLQKKMQSLYQELTAYIPNRSPHQSLEEALEYVTLHLKNLNYKN